MKIVPVLAITSLMLAGTAFAATGTTSSAAGASASTTHQASAKPNCRAEAKAKKLAGAERARFIKECTSTKS
jgi:hypothetical protein